LRRRLGFSARPIGIGAQPSSSIEVNMALPSQFSLLHSELNDFLFAQIGEEESGAPLSVLSALTRLGADPWAEGARLSDLPRDVAARALVPTIAMFPAATRGGSDVMKLAERLAALLPQRAVDPPTPLVGRGGRWRIGLPKVPSFRAGLFLALLLMAAYWLFAAQ
jgi:hypothetical protein